MQLLLGKKRSKKKKNNDEDKMDDGGASREKKSSSTDATIMEKPTPPPPVSLVNPSPLGTLGAPGSARTGDGSSWTDQPRGRPRLDVETDPTKPPITNHNTVKKVTLDDKDVITATGPSVLHRRLHGRRGNGQVNRTIHPPTL